MLSRSILAAFALVSISGVLSGPPRQGTNTNADIWQVLSSLSMSIHVNIPNIVTLQASGEANDETLAPEFQDLVTAFRTTEENLGLIPVSSGSTTVIPTNDDIGVVFGTSILHNTVGGLSGLTTEHHAERLPDMFAELDPAIAGSLRALNTTLPGSVGFVRILMLDARQFLVAQGLTQTLAALGF